MYNYLEMLNIDKVCSAPIKMTSCTESNLLKNNMNLILSHLAYKFIMLDKETTISSIVHKPSSVLEVQDENIDLGLYNCRLYNESSIYAILFAKHNHKITSSNFTSSIVYGYKIFSKLFVRCKIRFISREPVYIVYECLHGPEVLVSLRDIINRYGLTNDNLYKRRLERLYKSNITKQEKEQLKNEEPQILESVNKEIKNEENIKIKDEIKILKKYKREE